MVRSTIAILGLLAFYSLPASAQIISPGDLSRAHAAYDNLKSCTRCHSAQQRLSASACLTCHTELNARVEKSKGFHGRLPAEDRETCQSCHHEHQGRSFAIVDWTPSKFEHSRTGFALRGKHANATCESCHDTKKIVAEDVRRMLEQHPNAHTYLGLPTTCQSCHQDPHKEKLGSDCKTCHDETSWRMGSRFDHDKTGFPLTGRHEKVECKQCHPVAASGALLPDFPPVAHEQCTACHQDPHDKRFGARCDSCHTTASWHALKREAQERAFHAKTRFPLQGAHASTPCTSCHGPFGRGHPAKFKGLPFAQCTACHADAHGGQLAGKTGACERCHTVAGFEPASFDPKSHDRFPLTGAHAAVGCAECHAETFRDKHPPEKAPGRVLAASKIDFHPAHAACQTCHKDPHAGQFAPRTCEGCHGTESFHALAFDHDKETKFPLTGAHSSAACGECHTRTKPQDPVRFATTPTACSECHGDPHYGQLPRACDGCHRTTTFTEVTFDHEKTKFPLVGKHEKAACERCHPKIEVRPGLVVQRFVPTPQKCAACHTDPHGGAFKRYK